MASPTQYNFTWQEVAEALLKTHGIKDGKWQAGFEVGILVGTFPVGAPGAPAAPPSPDAQIAPGAMFVANNVILTAAKPDSPASLVVDASKLKQASSKK